MIKRRKRQNVNHDNHDQKINKSNGLRNGGDAILNNNSNGNNRLIMKINKEKFQEESEE